VPSVSQVVRRHGVDGLVVLGALAAALEVALVGDPRRAPETPLAFAVPAVMSVVLLLLARRRSPFRRARRALAAG
jgi:hypothetical protein